MNLKSILFALLGILAMFISACEPVKPAPVDRLAQRAAQAAEESAAATEEPHEINTIERRRLMMGKPGLILYVVFFNDMGQPIDYFVANGKCTSSNKRLTRGEELIPADLGEWNGHVVMDAASEDGTYGQSDEYIYCFTVDGKYKQWNGDYYASDHPIELTIKPLVIDLAEVGESGIQSQQ